jgi:hypothetical protein
MRLVLRVKTREERKTKRNSFFVKDRFLYSCKIVKGTNVSTNGFVIFFVEIRNLLSESEFMFL